MYSLVTILIILLVAYFLIENVALFITLAVNLIIIYIILVFFGFIQG